MQREFKVGDKVRMLDDCFGNKKGSVHTVTKDSGILLVRQCTCQEKWELIEEKTWETLAKGDVLVDGRCERAILTSLDGNFLISSSTDFDAVCGWYTINQLKNYGWTIKQPVTEMTVSEAEKLLEKSEGKKIKIVNL